MLNPLFSDCFGIHSHVNNLDYSTVQRKRTLFDWQLSLPWAPQFCGSFKKIWDEMQFQIQHLNEVVNMWAKCLNTHIVNGDQTLQWVGSRQLLSCLNTRTWLSTHGGLMSFEMQQGPGWSIQISCTYCRTYETPCLSELTAGDLSKCHEMLQKAPDA